MTCERQSLDILLRLSLIEGLTARHLGRLRSAQSTLPWPDARREGGRSIFAKASEALASRRAGEACARIREACAREGIRILPFGSEGYPEPLRAIADAPLVLYCAGAGIQPVEWSPDGTSGREQARGWADSVAIVGSRAPTGPGKAFAGELAAGLAAAGWTVVSGMARGIDAAAHEGALRGGGTTLAVLGCGVDVVYPPEARRLRDGILERGAILSEYPPGSRPLPHRFPARNRIISGLSRAVVVAEAPARSGALITARFALDQGKEVMAVPGSPYFPHTAGSNRLLRDGAAPVSGVEDVVAALGWPGGTAAKNSREDRILGCLSKARHVDEIAETTGIPVPELLPCLLEMEFRKLLERASGDYYKKMS